MRIVEATAADLEAVLEVERLAFGTDEEAELTRELLADPTAEPRLSLLALERDRPVGHVLFTAAHLGEPHAQVACSILAPLAVIPSAQRKGVGGALIARGMELQAQAGVSLVFLAGHPEYYPRHGFVPAAPHGFVPPHPVPLEHQDAWMVRELSEGSLGSIQGRVTCARALDRPEMWRDD